MPESNIWFLAATGMQRAMGREDYVRKLGEQIVRRYRIYSHNPFFNCAYVGTTSCGIPIHVNAEILRADYRSAIGSLPSHISQYYTFSTYPDLGAGIAWHPSDRRFQWVWDWKMLLNTLGSGQKDVVIYPYASAAYFEPGGIISE